MTHSGRTYPGVELALRQTNGDRAAARAVIHDCIIEQAEQEAMLAGLSLKCRVEMHAIAGNGCANDGSTCICACHDLSAGPYTEQETTK